MDTDTKDQPDTSDQSTSTETQNETKPAESPRAVMANGETLDDAIEEACRLLSATRDQIDVAVVESGGSSFMRVAIGAKYRIRAVLRPEFHKVQQKGVTYLSRDDLSRLEQEAGPDAMTDENDLTNPRTVLAAICNRIQPGTRVERYNREGTIHLRIVGDGSGLFIGNRGQTLDSLQYIVNKIVQRAANDESIKVVVDSENYRSRKNDRIEHLARNLAAEAHKTGRMVETEPLSAYDRRTIHLIVRDQFEGLATRSVGDGEFKRVQIFAGEPGAERSERPQAPKRSGRPERSERPKRPEGGSGQKRGGRGSRGGRGGRGRDRRPERPAGASQDGKPIEIRGAGGFDSDRVDPNEPIPDLIVDKSKFGIDE